MRFHSGSPLAALFAAAGTCLVIACVGDDPPVGAPPPDGVDASTSADGAASSGGPGADACATTCTGACVDTSTDPDHCGACNTSCQRPAGKFACVGGKCGNEVMRVFAGTYNGCVLLRDATVWCWGDRAAGVTGEPPNATPSPAPRKIPTLTDVVDLAVGHQHACAAKSDGSVWCWGDNGRMQTGTPSNGTGCAGANNAFCWTPRQVPLPAGVKITQLSAGLAATCARTAGAAGGDVYCWGHNASRLIDGSVDDLASVRGPTRIASSVFAGDVAEVSLGYHDGSPIFRQHACARKSDGTVWCWGANDKGQLGHAGGGDITCAARAEPASTVACNPTPVKVSIADAKTVHALVDASCLLKNDKSVWCWGSRFYGQSGVTSDDAATPQQVPDLNTTERLDARGLAAFATDSAGNVKAWGEAGYFSVASTSATVCGDSTCFPTPTSVASLAGSDEISPGLLVGFVRRGGKVLGWGRNSYGTLGHAPNTNGDTACAYAPSGGDICNPNPVAVIDLP